MMRIRTIVLLSAVFTGLSGCVAEKTTLRNDQGQTQTCENKYFGLTGYLIMHSRYKDCFEKAKANGFNRESERRHADAKRVTRPTFTTLVRMIL